MQPSDNAQPTPVLEARGIAKHFTGKAALEGVNLSLHQGQWLGLLGPNGAGKTTLMNILAGLLKADEGQFLWQGNPFDPCQSSPTTRCIGLVPQGIALYQDLTAMENLEVFARFHGLKGREALQRATWALNWTGLASRAEERVSTFSGGMKRRLNIACGILHDPKLLLLDEPTVGVDPQARQKIWNMLKELQETGTALIHSSHQLDEVENSCDQVVILDHGKLLGAGPIETLLRSFRLTSRIIRLRFDQPPDPKVFPDHFRVEDTRVSGEMQDPAHEFPDLLSAAGKAGLAIMEVQLTAPSLEDLFTEITGKELRE